MKLRFLESHFLCLDYLHEWEQLPKMLLDFLQCPPPWQGKIWPQTSTVLGWESLPWAEAWCWRAGGHGISWSICRDLVPPACPAPVPRPPGLVCLSLRHREGLQVRSLCSQLLSSFRGATISLETSAGGKMGDDKWNKPLYLLSTY